MKKVTLFLLLFCNMCLANMHKDILVNEYYGNVNVLLRTGFQYSEIEKIKIIGKLSEKLCTKLHFKDRLFVEYIHDYTKIYSKDIYKFEDRTTSIGFMDGLRSKYIKKESKGVSVRINADNVNITNVLRLIEYAINNRKNLDEKLTDVLLIDRWGDNDTELEFKIRAIPVELLRQIFDSKSDIIQDVITNKIFISSENIIGIDFYWTNDKFVIEYKFREEPVEKLLEVEDFYYFIRYGYSILVFLNTDDFYLVLPNDENNSSLLRIKDGPQVPYKIIADFNNKIVLQNYYWSANNENDLLILLKNKRKVISKFE